MNYQITLSEGTNILKKNFVKNPILDSEILLASVLKIKREKLLLNLDKAINDKQLNNFYNLTFGRSRWFDKMDASFWSSKYSIPFFCNSGDLIITRQSAIHGAFPAEKKYKRIMMVKHYIT